MSADSSLIDFRAFVNDRLAARGFSLRLVTENLMLERLDDFMNFVNSVRREHQNRYHWNEESRDYFLKELVASGNTASQSSMLPTS